MKLKAAFDSAIHDAFEAKKKQVYLNRSAYVHSDGGNIVCSCGRKTWYQLVAADSFVTVHGLKWICRECYERLPV